MKEFISSTKKELFALLFLVIVLVLIFFVDLFTGFFGSNELSSVFSYTYSSPISGISGGPLFQVASTGQNDEFENNNLASVTVGVDNASDDLYKTKISEHSKEYPQFVVLAFDGSYSIEQWEKTRSFAKEMQAEGKPVHFTYFLNAVYLLDPDHKDMYQAPDMPKGVSNIGFGASKENVLARIYEINRAIEEGHEIGSHNAGHFNGVKWSYESWKSQLDLFSNIVFGIKNIDADYSLNLKQGDIVGFRAPDLGVNEDTYKALKDSGFRYDTSKVAMANQWPYRDKYGLWQLPLATISIRDPKTGKNRHTIGMDYSLYMLQTKAHNKAKKGTPLWDELYNDTLKSFRDYFYGNYNGNHAPVYFANHFSTWNDGVYLEAMKAFAKEVCGLKDVQCVTYRDVVNFMDGLDRVK